ncbi:MAG: hypothetical protein K8I03_06700, partial [Ignavibacteria bacterium]|nr:hypothetical protein [Ignavibacteria bacterium]
MTKQLFKSVYFPDYPSADAKSKSITIAFNESEKYYYSSIKNLSNEEIRELIGINSYKKLERFAEKEDRSVNQTVKRLLKQKLPKVSSGTDNLRREVTFIDSKNIPFQRWYPYIEGYSINFVRTLIREFDLSNKLIYEPFAGTGTTVFAADDENLNTVYSEVNPLLQYLIQTKIQVLQLNMLQRTKLAEDVRLFQRTFIDELVDLAEDTKLKEAYKTLFSKSKYFPEATLRIILKLRTLIDEIKLEDELLADVLTIAILASLLPISYLKKVGDVRFKTPKEIEKELKVITEILPMKLAEIVEDILNFDYKLKNSPEFILANAKNIGRLNNLKIGAIITSPPYLNGTNYFRNTKLELWFLRYLQHENDLRFFRNQALTSGINDVKMEYASINGLDISTKSKILKLTLIELNKKAYDARIPIMAKSYFEEMYRFFQDMTLHLENNATVLIDIGDSIFSNIHIKTDKILIELLEEIGYKLSENRLLRKRRSKNKEVLSQSLLVFKYLPYVNWKVTLYEPYQWESNWKSFKTDVPHQEQPFSKRNWGHPNHSLCSYQGKLKPALANHLVKTFVPDEGSFLDPFAGVGTLPFEASLSNKLSYGIDISLPAYYISSAKVSYPNKNQCYMYIKLLEDFIQNNEVTRLELDEANSFGLNKTISQYYQKETLNEILLARRFIKIRYPKTPSEMLVIASLLHILHGNRPYALSRRSHPIVPYAPTGKFEYKSLISKLTEKVERVINIE